LRGESAASPLFDNVTMKTLLIAVLAIAALALTFGERPGTQTGQAAWDDRLTEVDGYLQEGLTEETHDAISNNARDGADWIVGFGTRFGTAGE
jgi:hypothetical protein